MFSLLSIRPARRSSCGTSIFRGEKPEGGLTAKTLKEFLDLPKLQETWPKLQGIALNRKNSHEVFRREVPRKHRVGFSGDFFEKKFWPYHIKGLLGIICYFFLGFLSNSKKTKQYVKTIHKILTSKSQTAGRLQENTRSMFVGRT